MERTIHKIRAYGNKDPQPLQNLILCINNGAVVFYPPTMVTSDINNATCELCRELWTNGVYS